MPATLWQHAATASSRSANPPVLGEPDRAEFAAVVRQLPLAVHADPAGEHGVVDDPVSDDEIGDAGAEVLDDSEDFVASDRWITRAEFAMVDVYIGATDPGHGHADYDLACLRCGVRDGMQLVTFGLILDRRACELLVVR